MTAFKFLVNFQAAGLDNFKSPSLSSLIGNFQWPRPYRVHQSYQTTCSIFAMKSFILLVGTLIIPQSRTCWTSFSTMRFSECKIHKLHPRSNNEPSPTKPWVQMWKLYVFVSQALKLRGDLGAAVFSPQPSCWGAQSEYCIHYFNMHNRYKLAPFSCSLQPPPLFNCF